MMRMNPSWLIAVLLGLWMAGQAIESTAQPRIGGGEAQVQKGRDKPPKTPRCADIEETCPIAGQARWCVCRQGGGEKTVQCGCKPGASPGGREPSSPGSPGGSRGSPPAR